MKRNCWFLLVLLPLMAPLFSCTVAPSSPQIIDCPEALAFLAYRYALEYDAIDTQYEWGGQDPLRAAKLDCSGLVIRCYQYALAGTPYSLLLPDMSSSYMHDNAATLIPLEQLRPGDVIFMGQEDSPVISHIALYVKTENGEIHFIDSTKKPAHGAVPAVNGVSQRSYPVDDKRFKSGGILKVKY